MTYRAKYFSLGKLITYFLKLKMILTLIVATSYRQSDKMVQNYIANTYFETFWA